MTIMQKRLGALGTALVGSFVIVACVAAFTFTVPAHAPSPGLSSTPARAGSSSPAASAPASASSSGSPASSVSSPPAAGVNPQVVALVPSAKRNGSVSVAMYPATPPYEQVKDGKIVGVDADLAAALGAVMGVQWKLASVTVSASDPFGSIIQDVRSGRYDVGLSNLTETKGREQQVDFVTYFKGSDGPHGIAFPKNDGMAQATQAALKALIANGTYGEILARWKLGNGAVTVAQVTINSPTGQ